LTTSLTVPLPLDIGSSAGLVVTGCSGSTLPTLDKVPIPSTGSIPSAARAPSAAQPAAVYPPTTGIYAVGYTNGAIPRSILTNPSVDGIDVRTTWDSLEPASSVYDWTYLNRVLQTAAGAGKKVSLSLTAGIHTPAWVYAAGAQAFSYIDASSPATQTIPIPWDPIFLAQWKSLIHELGIHFAANPTLTQIKITGIETNTAETMLPHSQGKAVSNGTTTWNTTNDLAAWQAVGYTRSRVKSAWQTIAGAWAHNFPNQQISAVLVPNSFPPIGENGAVLGGQQTDNQIVTDLINRGMARYATQFVVQNNGLSDNWIFSQIANMKDQVTTGYQTLWWVTGDNTYKMNNGKAIAITTELQTALDRAIAAHARFLELYPEDLVNPELQGVLAAAHAGLAGNARPLGMITGLPAPGSLVEGTHTITLGSALADPNATSAAGFTYAWIVRHNGQTLGSGAAATFTFTANDSGRYIVSLQVTDPAGNSSWVNAQTITIASVLPMMGLFPESFSVPEGQADPFAALTDPGPENTV
jgi:hypothetical protein